MGQKPATLGGGGGMKLRAKGAIGRRRLSHWETDGLGLRFGQFVLVCLLVVGATACQVRQPGAVETAFMQGFKRKVSVGGRKDANPLAADSENIRAGQQNFSHYCMVCHGLDGQNTGVPFADRMSPPVPRLNSAAVQLYSDGQLKWIIDHGISPSGMPASKGILNDEEIWQIVHYLRHLPAKGSLGEPEAYR